MQFSVPTISICIAAYNVESYISECLLSIFQFEKTIQKEIIIVDDCSNDNTVKIVRFMIKKYGEENIILIENNQNLGPAGSYNMAVKHAHGKYITFLDSDDFLIASGLSKKVEILENNRELQLIYGNGVFFEK
jgi:teichuronic acid biosynthesis glycosyltransferase TuaG